MFQVKRPKYDELKDTLKLLLVFREEFSDIYPEADITRVAITIQKHLMMDLYVTLMKIMQS